MKVRYYIIDVYAASIRGTNSETVVNFYVHLDGYLVVDAKTSEVLVKEGPDTPLIAGRIDLLPEYPKETDQISFNFLEK